MFVCLEFILAIVYFLVIFVVNFFLFKVLKNYWENIIYLMRLKNIYQNYKNENLFNISYLYLYLNKEINSRKLITNLSNEFIIQDMLIIGNISKLLKTKKSSNLGNNYYFELLEKQYLSNKNKKE
jgi:hypothetical protein